MPAERVWKIVRTSPTLIQVRIVLASEHSDGWKYGVFCYYSTAYPTPGWKYLPTGTSGRSSRTFHPDVLTCARSRKMGKTLITALIQFLRDESDAVPAL